jgi:predicted nucleotidyltransferase
MDRTLIKQISNYLANQPVERAWIFGSYARSEENNLSDIDILVNFIPNTKLTLFKYFHIISDLQLLTGKNIDLIEEGQLKSFAKETAESEKILIYERRA